MDAAAGVQPEVVRCHAGRLVLWPIFFGLFTRSLVYGVFGAALSLKYLSAIHPETDDHLIIKERGPNLWAFLSGLRRT